MVETWNSRGWNIHSNIECLFYSSVRYKTEIVWLVGRPGIVVFAVCIHFQEYASRDNNDSRTSTCRLRIKEYSYTPLLFVVVYPRRLLSCLWPAAVVSVCLAFARWRQLLRSRIESHRRITATDEQIWTTTISRSGFKSKTFKFMYPDVVVVSHNARWNLIGSALPHNL